MTPRHFVLASGDVVVSYAAPASPPAVLVGAGILDCVGIVGADDTVATINLLVERDVGDGDTLKLLEPPLDFSRVDRWWEIPVHWPFRGSRADWKE
jgi:hypothetical protein